MKVVAAVRELENEKTYEGKVQFTLVPHTQEGFDEEVAQWDIGSHGLVGLNPSGKAVTKIEGHSFGKDEIVRAVEDLLDS